MNASPAWKLARRGKSAKDVFAARIRISVVEICRIKNSAWPEIYRSSRYVPAVEYLQAMRSRTLIMRSFAQHMGDLDLFVAPGVGSYTLGHTNLTGHPSVVLPSGFRKEGSAEHPSAVTFTGRLYGEAELLAVAHAYQQATGFHLRRPPMDRLQVEKPAIQ